MASDGILPVPSLAVRSSTGTELWSSAGLKDPYVPNENFSRDESKFCRAVVFSPDGRYLAWVNGVTVNISTTHDWKIIRSLPRPKAFYLKFSPNANYLMTWESFSVTKENPEGSPNLLIYNTITGEEVFSTIQKKNSVWEPSWSNDESILALMLGGEAFFYETTSTDGFKKVAKKIGGGRNGLLSVSPNGNNPYVAFYVPGVKGAPSMCKIFKYPDLQAAQPIGCKSFFQADTVEMLWNKRGTGLLLLTSTDVDQSGASYYGKQALHFMSTKGDSYAVQLSKEGSVHAVSWNPNSNEFCVVYGFMPAKATFFNLKCDATFECGEGDRNCIYYNNFGNLVILAGFGNLRGSVEIWDVAQKKLITSIKAPDSTLLEWCPNGEMFVTATTAPRLRMSNGFKVWHYSGALLHETIWPTGQELLEVVWQKYVDGTFKEQKISFTKIEGIVSSQPQASSEPYRPPNARGIFITSSSTKSDSTKSSKDKRTKRTQNFKKRNEEREDNPSRDLNSSGDTSNVNVDNKNNRNTAKKWTPPVPTEDPEKIKRMKALNKKLNDITKLKSRREKGEHLESNQLSKINSEAELAKELNELKMT